MPNPAGQPLVLVADDSDTVRAVSRLELESAGYAVLEAVNGRLAVELAGQHVVDVILLDVQMPEMTGHQALTALKADAATRDIPVVFLSGSGTGEDVVDALREGAHDYLRKPPVPAELLARVASAYRIKQLQDQLRERAVELNTLSRTDHLTGLHNRRHAEEHLRLCLAGAKRHDFGVAVLLADVDHFKSINDSRGHAGGDDVLFEVAQVISREVRAEDVAARWGGEEFVVVATHTDVAATGQLAERLRVTVASTCGVTVSIGAVVGAGEEDAMLSAADQNLYAAKAAGRDRCIVTALV